MILSAYIPLFLILVSTELTPGGERPRPPPAMRPPRETVSLRGRVLVPSPLIDVPISYARLELFREGKVVASAATDRQGYFKFVQHLPNGLYELVLDSGDYEGKLTVIVGDKPPDVVLFATRRVSRRAVNRADSLRLTD